MVNLLLDAGVDPNGAKYPGETPIYWAVMNRKEDMVKLLLDRGAEPCSADTWEGKDIMFLSKCI